MTLVINLPVSAPTPTVDEPSLVYATTVRYGYTYADRRASTTVTLYYGTADQGTTWGSWASNVSMGTKLIGPSLRI